MSPTHLPNMVFLFPLVYQFIYFSFLFFQSISLRIELTHTVYLDEKKTQIN